MADAKVMATSVILDNNDYKFTSSGQVGIFDGYLKVYGEFEESKDTYLPDFASFNSNIIVKKLKQLATLLNHQQDLEKIHLLKN